MTGDTERQSENGRDSLFWELYGHIDVSKGRDFYLKLVGDMIMEIFDQLEEQDKLSAAIEQAPRDVLEAAYNRYIIEGRSADYIRGVMTVATDRQVPFNTEINDLLANLDPEDEKKPE